MRKDLAQLGKFCDLLGNFSEHYLAEAKRRDIYFTGGLLNNYKNTTQKSFKESMNERLEKVKFPDENDKKEFISFLKRSLEFENRATAEELLQDDWLKGVPDI